MGLFRWTFRDMDDAQLRDIAGHVVQRSLSEVMQRVSGLTPDMSPAEARGYIRTRAAKVVNRELTTILSMDRRLAASDRTPLTALVTDTLVAAVLAHQSTQRRPLAA